jgi:imidazolonepropionase-like amidohydrolase
MTKWHPARNQLLRSLSILALVSSPIAHSGQQPRSTYWLAFTDVTVIDGTGVPAQPKMTVLIEKDRIASVGKQGSIAIPAGAEVLDANGGVLIPGLWDMHVHLSWTKACALPALVANGVTGVRDMGGLLEELNDWRARIEAGCLVGPRIVRSGPVINGKQAAFHQFAVTNEAEARGAVRALHKAGVDFIKLHRALSREAYFGVADECKKLGFPFVGHVPQTVTPFEASDAGQASFEHLSTLFDGTFSAGLQPSALAGAIEQFKRESAEETFARFAKNSTSFTPTLVSYIWVAQLGRRRPDPLDKYVSHFAKKLEAEAVEKHKDELTPAFYENLEQQFKSSIGLVGLMQKAGVRILTGTDLASAGTYPGFDLHEELALLVKAGLTPMEALQCATRNAAEFLKRFDLGTIQSGKIADVVLLDANPLEDIRNTRRISAVVISGKLLKRPALDGLLLEAARLAKAD